MTDRELLELAAKAAGVPYIKPSDDYDGSLGLAIGDNPMRTRTWNPLTDDGDALRLAVKLVIDIGDAQADYWDKDSTDPYAATRRAIVRAAAVIGKAMK